MPLPPEFGLVWLLRTEGRTLSEIGAVLGRSRERVRQMWLAAERRALRAVSGNRCGCGHHRGWHGGGYWPYRCLVPGCACAGFAMSWEGAPDGSAAERDAYRRAHPG